MPTDIPALREALAKIQDREKPLPWVVHTGSSFRRIASESTREDGNVLHAICHRDGCLDLSMGEDQLVPLVLLVNSYASILDELEALRGEAGRLRNAGDKMAETGKKLREGIRFIGAKRDPAIYERVVALDAALAAWASVKGGGA